MEEVSVEDFRKVDLRVGQVFAVETLPEADRPAYVLRIDFGDKIGIRKSSAQITDLYEPSSLVGKRVVAAVNLPEKQVGKMMSECLVTGFHDSDGRVVLCVPDKSVPLGARLL